MNFDPSLGWSASAVVPRYPSAHVLPATGWGVHNGKQIWRGPLAAATQEQPPISELWFQLE